MEMDNKAVFLFVVSGRSEHFILLTSCGGKNISNRYLWRPLLRNMLAVAGQEWQLLRLRETTHCCECQKTDTYFRKHWPGPA